MIDDPLLVLEAGTASTGREVAERAGEEWPGVADPDVLRGQLLDWFAQYDNAGTRRTYAYALGLPIAWVDALGGTLHGGEPRRKPPAAAPGPLHALAWFRWCATRDLDPRTATSAHVKAWLHALSTAGAARRTRQRMLATLSALYGHLAETGAVTANPAAIDRRRLGLVVSTREPSPTIRLTAGQVAALLDASTTLRHSPALRELYATRARAVVALLTLGLRISELTGLDRGDLVRTGGDQVLRVQGKGGVRREVYVTDLVRQALSDYLAERDRAGATAVPARRGTTRAAPEPLVATRDGNRCSRVDLYRLLRRVAAAAGPELADVADRIHPHALRHAYVTIALEQDARIQHVRADVGHASITTTEHYDRGMRTRDTTAADLVAAAIAAARQRPDETPSS
ncbi:MAG: tyrosine-type recombinase/integrase [Pseudonocardia sp.]|uniref:tyrosine-type recombinase/integrase n=1 Tax=unclassified Pseudonocardia TaxID=2619320 RepID=UPI000A8BF131|nr:MULTISPECIES: tyrosine-type recombinase/integrase [unclassified Pseudonocardia]MBN9112542.1 tyrosine-type recombinase/integrase [Pseudonocardia sp.]